MIEINGKKIDEPKFKIGDEVIACLYERDNGYFGVDRGVVREITLEDTNCYSYGFESNGRSQEYNLFSSKKGFLEYVAAIYKEKMKELEKQLDALTEGEKNARL